MQTSSRRIKVQKVISGRYPDHIRPLRWDDRTAGVEKVLSTSGEEVVLYSNGGQSTPESGWEILLIDTVHVAEAGTAAQTWTLYGISAV